MDQKISLEEFKEFYNNISCTIEDDAYFEVMLNNAWKMGEQVVKKAEAFEIK